MITPLRLSRCWLVSVVAVAALLLGIGEAAAQRDQHGRNTAPILAAFRGVVSRPSESVVRVLADDKDAALGAIISADGWIVTKSSLLKGKLVCKLKDGRTFPARLTGVEETHDLAMLKIDASGLKPIEWKAAKTAEVGDWVATALPGDLPVAVGVVSVAVRSPSGRDVSRRAPAPNSGYLGIGLDPGENGVAVIAMIEKGGAAEKAGLKVGDVVLTVAGRKVPSPDRLVTAIQGFKPGQVVILRVKRGEKETDVRATLGKRPASMINRGDMMNMMGSTLSERRGGFPVILQHDTVIKPTDCGGPLVDLDGKAVGINIARAGRTESYAIPAEAVQALFSDLQSGKLAPKEDPEEKRLAELEEALNKAKTEVTKAEAELKSASDDKKQALETKLGELRKKLDETQHALDKARPDPTKK
ncbi:MAG: PDZ domain-containing protein [Gemmataceae bacterium]